MADWNVAEYARSFREQHVQRQREAAERAQILEHLDQNRAEHLANWRPRERNRNDAPLKPDGKVYTAREIGECVQATRIRLDRAAERLRCVEARLLLAEESFERAGYHLDDADACLGRARERILQLQSEQVERRIQCEELAWLDR